MCERGYASVFADMTGTGASEGDYGESFDLAREGRDAAAIVEWVAGQDWCDGRVGAWGVSYGGMTALAAAAQPLRPSLRAIIAVYATTDIYRDTIAPGGCPAMLGRYAWAAHMMALGLCPPTRPDPGGRWRRTWTRRLRRLAGAPSHAVTWQAHPDRDAYWDSRVLDAAAIDVPVMLIGGWADMFKDAMTSLYEAVTGPKRLVMGPWMHVLPHLSGVEPYDWVSEMADWWDEHLAAGARSPAAGPGAVLRPRRWLARRRGQWPPEGAGTRRLFLAGHGLALAAGRAGPSRLPRRRRGRRGRGHVGPVRHGKRLARGAERGRRQEPDLHQRAAARAAPDRRASRGRALPVPAGRGRGGAAGGPAGHGRPGRPLDADHHRLAPVGACRRRRSRPRWGRTGGDHARGGRVRRPGRGAAAAVRGLRRLPPHLAVGGRTRRSASASARTVPRRCAYPCCDHDVAPAGIPAPPAVPDPGWVTEGEPRYHVAHDKAAGEVAVTFGARSSLRPPSGTEMSLDERFTARVRPGRPAGAALTAQVDVGLRLPGGERVDVAVRSTSSRTTSLTQGRVTLDGALLFEHTWTTPPIAETERTTVDLLGYAQPCVAHAGEFVEVKVSTTQPGFTAEVVRLGLTVRPAVPQVADGHFPGRRQELISGSYLIASLGESLAGRRAQRAVLVLPHPAGGTAVPDGGVRRRRGLGSGRG